MKHLRKADPKPGAVLRQLIRTAVREARKDMPGLTEGKLRRAIQDRAKRQKIAKKKGAKPGTKKWRDLLKERRVRRKKAR